MNINKFETFFKENIINNKRNLYSKSYFKKNTTGKWEWITSRCRIDPCFWVDVIIEFLTKANHKTSNDINEYYLLETRKITNNLKEYENSHAMDINAIKSWFRINDKLNQELANKMNEYSYEKIKFVITNYINDVIKKESINNKLSKSWLEKQENKIWLNELISNTKIREFYMYGNEIVDNNIKNNKWNIIDRYKWHKPSVVSNDIQYYESNEGDSSNKEINEIIGFHGEKIAYEFLKNKYGNLNVDWISKENKYCPFDFKINIDQQDFYIEVKSSKKQEMSRFFLSINEYNFYTKNIDNYKLMFIWNIYETRNDNRIPILFLEKPQFKISMEKEGFDGQEEVVYLTPHNFKSAIYK